MAAAHRGRVLAGWPLVRGDQEAAGHYAPLFFRAGRLERQGQDVVFTVDAGEVELNHFALKELGVSHHERDEVVHEISKAMARCGTPSEALAEGLNALASLGVTLDVEALDSSRLQPVDPEEGTVNAAVLFVAERGRATGNLLRDLDAMARLSDAELGRGPLGILLGARANRQSDAIAVYPSVVESNLAQDRAVFRGMTDELAVVTGPPGTGKSQVLVNGVAACLAEGQSVLFASKNNQAVEVVFHRVAKVGDEAVLLRAGRSALRAELAVAVEQALAHPPAPPPESKQAAVEWRGVRRRVLELHETPSKRRRLQAQRAELSVVVAELRGRLPRGFDLIPNRDTTRSAILEIRDLQRRLTKHEASFWPCVRWNIPSLERALGGSYEVLCTTLPATAASALSTRPESLDCEALLEGLGVAAQFHQASAELAQLEEELASLLSDEEVDDLLTALQAERLEVGRILFRAAWARVLADPSCRGAAGLLASALRGVVDGSGSARQMLAAVPDAMHMFPAWGVSSLSARTNFPLDAGLFDLVIFDEAAACDLASALPVLYRAKRAMVIGDPMQLTHICNLRSRTDEALASDAGLSEKDHAEICYPTRSLYDVAASKLGRRPEFLSQHFRSRPDIIRFSNQSFYKASLRLMRPANPERPAISWEQVPGTFTRRRGRSAINMAEVEAVVALLLERCPEWHAAGFTVGVVSPFRAHVDAIAEELAKRAPDIAATVTVDTAHKYQGDERDVMIFSPVVSPAMPESLLSFAGKPNLLNVALTRAREQVVVVGDGSACRSAGGLLGKLVEYIQTRPLD
jgi:hypothetical protein